MRISRLRKAILVLISVVAVGAALALSTAPAAAVDPLQAACTGGGAASPACSTAGGTDPVAGPNGAIVKITGILALVAGIVSVMFVLWGGFSYITAGGDSSSIAKAKNTIIFALVGLVVAAMARPLINFVLSKSV
jgi:hypothetical protein